MLKEFKQFALKGNVMDMAIGVIIGGSFGKIVSSLVTDIIMPPFGLILGGVDFTKFSWTLKQATETAPAISLNYGIFFNTILDFLIISLSIYFVVKQINKVKKKLEKEEKKESVDKPSEDILLLREIRDSLKK